MFPLLLIVLGILVLAFGTRLAVLGAAVGGLLGVALIHFLPGGQGPLVALGIPIGLAVLGGIGAGFMKGIIHIVILVIGALAGAAIVIGFLDLLNLNMGLLDLILAIVGGFVGAIVVTRFQDIALVVLAGLVGALLVMRGVGILLPSLPGPIATLLTLVIAGGAIAYNGGFLGRRGGSAQPPSTPQPPSTQQ